MESNDDQTPPLPAPDGLPPLPSRPRPTLWGRIAVGFIPAVLLLAGLFFAVAIDPGLGGPEEMFLIVGLIAIVLGTPILLIPWSHQLLKAIHGPIPDDKRTSRIGMIILVAAGMCFANFVVVFAGCSAILITMG